MRALFLALPLALAACAPDADEATVDVPATDPEVATVEPAPAAAGTMINLNTASMDDFKTIPGVGDRMAHEFDEYRPYVSIAQFRQEIGKYVPADTVARYEQYVFVPVDPEASDAATLAQLPGVDDAEAETLMAGRPYASRAAFIEALQPLTTPTELAEAEVYLTSGS